jgi:hypothetical protein
MLKNRNFGAKLIRPVTRPFSSATARAFGLRLHENKMIGRLVREPAELSPVS